MPIRPSNTNLTDQSCIAGTAPIITSDQSTLAILPSKPGKANSIVKPCKQGKVGSAPKPDYALIEPPSYRITTQYPQWCSTMDDKFTALKRQGTWSLVPPSPSQNLVGCKWVFKLKRNSYGSINRYKAMLVAIGFH